MPTPQDTIAALSKTLQEMHGLVQQMDASTLSAQPFSVRAKRIDLIATAFLQMAEALEPVEDGREDLVTEALVLTLMRRLGPYGYSRFTEWMPVSKAS